MQISSNTPRLGLGCWPLSGPLFHGTTPKHYADTDPAESLRALEAAYANGIRLFDTAAVYGAGAGERLVGQALRGKSDAVIVTKIGTAFDEDTHQILYDETEAHQVATAVDRCLKRLGRDHIDVVLLHLNALPIAQALPIIEALDQLRKDGKIGSFGWSTDFPESIAALSGRDGFSAIEHAMNVFFDVPSVHAAVENAGVWGLVRSPLAMGLLSGKTSVSDDDVRAHDNKWNNYFPDGVANQSYLDQIAAVRDLLQTGGRSLVQGALSWVLAKGDKTIPLPGARTVAQVEENAKTLDFGPLDAETMQAIEDILGRPPEGPPRNR